MEVQEEHMEVQEEAVEAITLFKFTLHQTIGFKDCFFLHLQAFLGHLQIFIKYQVCLL